MGRKPSLPGIFLIPRLVRHGERVASGRLGLARGGSGWLGVARGGSGWLGRRARPWGGPAAGSASRALGRCLAPISGCCVGTTRCQISSQNIRTRILSIWADISRVGSSRPQTRQTPEYRSEVGSEGGR
eukprot:7167721-Prymnesium_polylepis.1